MYANKLYSHRNHGNTFNKQVDYPLFTEYVLGRFLSLLKRNVLCLFDIENKDRFRIDRFNWNIRPTSLFIFSSPFLESVDGSTYEVFRPI